MWFFNPVIVTQFYARCIFKKKGQKKVHLVICNGNTLNGNTYEIESCAASVVVAERQWTGLWTGREKRGGACLHLLAIMQMKYCHLPPLRVTDRPVMCLRDRPFCFSYRNNKELVWVNHKAGGGGRGAVRKCRGPPPEFNNLVAGHNELWFYISARVLTIIIPNAARAVCHFLEIWKLWPAVIRALRAPGCPPAKWLS